MAPRKPTATAASPEPDPQKPPEYTPDLTLRPGEPDPRPVVDVDPRAITAEEAVGTEALAPREGEANGNYLVIRGENYPLPRIGPLIYVILPKLQRQHAESVARFERLKARDVEDMTARLESGLGQIELRLMELLVSLAENSIPETVLVTLNATEIGELMNQLRPLGGAVDSGS